MIHSCKRPFFDPSPTHILTLLRFAQKWNTVKSLIRDAPNLKTYIFFSSCFVVVFAQSVGARCWVENEDVVGAAPVSTAPAASEWSTIILPTDVRLILEVQRCVFFSQFCSQCGHEAWMALVRFLIFLMLMEFVYFFSCFFSLFCYVTLHDDIVIHIKLHVFPTVYTRVTYSTVTSRVNGASANDQKKVIDNVIHEISWLIWAKLLFFKILLVMKMISIMYYQCLLIPNMKL